MIFTGQNTKAQEAKRIGLVNEVFPIEELENGDKIIVTAAPPVDKSISHRLTDIKCNIQIEYATWDELI